MNITDASWIVADVSADVCDLQTENGSCCPKTMVERLLSLIERSGAVVDPATLRADILAREMFVPSKINDSFFMPHVCTAGVSSLCAAAVVVPRKGIFVLAAWPRNSNFCLKRISALMDVFLDGNLVDRFYQMANGDDFLYNLDSALSRSGVTCYDTENTVKVEGC